MVNCLFWEKSSRNKPENSTSPLGGSEVALDDLSLRTVFCGEMEKVRGSRESASPGGAGVGHSPKTRNFALGRKPPFSDSACISK